MVALGFTQCKPGSFIVGVLLVKCSLLLCVVHFAADFVSWAVVISERILIFVILR